VGGGLLNISGALVELWMTGKAELLRGKLAPMPLCPPQVVHGLLWDWSFCKARRQRSLPDGSIWVRNYRHWTTASNRVKKLTGSRKPKFHYRVPRISHWALCSASSILHALLHEVPFWYPPTYACVSLVTSSLEIFQPKFCSCFLFLSCLLHVPPISSSLM